MSVSVPYTNTTQASGTGNLTTRYSLPSAAAQKPANTSFVLGLWIRPPDAALSATAPSRFLGSQSAGTGGNDSYIGFTDKAMGSIDCSVRRGAVQRFSQTLALGSSAYGKTLLVMLIADATSSHLVVAEPGGTPLIVTQPDNLLYGGAWTTLAFMQHLASTPTTMYRGDIDEYFFLHGSFPMVTGSPDPALVQAIADGSQDLDTLEALMTGAVRQCRYRMRDAFDLADAWGLQAPLTPLNVNAATGAIFRSAGPLRPRALRPARTRSQVSQCTFATPGVAASATASIAVEGGAYAGISPAAIQARLLKSDGTDHVAWTVIDAAPAGGAWVGGAITGVPMVAGLLTLELRAVDGGGAQIGETAFSDGQRGAGAVSFLSEGQSQLMKLWVDGSIPLPDGINVVATIQDGTTATGPAGTTFEAIVTSGVAAADVIGWGMRQAVIEINTLYPGVPIGVLTVGTVGEPLSQWGTGGLFVQRWGWLAAHLGVVPAHQLVFFGHSNVSEPDDLAYRDKLTEVTGIAETALGTYATVIQCSTTRYSGIGTGGSWPTVNRARNGMRLWVEANPGKGFWGGSWSSVFTSEPPLPATDPHPVAADNSAGRSGALLAWASMMAARAVVDLPVTIKTATASGTSVALKFDAVQNIGSVPIIGTGAGTLPLGGGGAGTVDVSGTGADTLPLGGGGAGAVDVSGGGAGTLPLGGGGAGAVGSGPITGTGAGTLSLGGGGAGTVDVIGVGAVVLGIAGSGSGTGPVTSIILAGRQTKTSARAIGGRGYFRSIGGSA